MQITFLRGGLVAKTKAGEAIRPSLRTGKQFTALKRLARESKKAGDIKTWVRAKCVLGYIGGGRAEALAAQFDTTRGSVNRWLVWYNAEGAGGLREQPRPGRPRELTQRDEDLLCTLIDQGPQTAGFTTGVWTGPMIRELIRNTFGISYHKHHIPRLLARLGYSVQRPRKRLAKADKEAQDNWIHVRLPRIKKKRPPVEVW